MKKVINMYWTELHGQRVQVKVYEAATKDDMDMVNREEVETEDDGEDWLETPKYQDDGDLVDILSNEQLLWDELDDEEPAETETQEG